MGASCINNVDSYAYKLRCALRFHWQINQTLQEACLIILCEYYDKLVNYVNAYFRFMLLLLQTPYALVLIKRIDNPGFDITNFEDVNPFQDDQIYNYFF